mmetsp:Transcript_6118/g.17464  ORF Transcript_6118/g.17464 Transcript_6118/m.17464 type:complete len:85 (+) Transcript_6118:1180-1434(+)
MDTTLGVVVSKSEATRCSSPVKAAAGAPGQPEMPMLDVESSRPRRCSVGASSDRQLVPAAEHERSAGGGRTHGDLTGRVAHVEG